MPAVRCMPTLGNVAVKESGSVFIKQSVHIVRLQRSVISKINVMWCDACSILACRGLLNWTGHCEVKTKILVVRLQPMKDLPGRICEVIKENIQKLNDFKLGIALTQMMSHQTDQMNSCSERQRADRLTYWFIHLLNSLLLLHAADKKK